MDDISQIDVRKLERLYLEVSSDLRSLHIVNENLKAENEHLLHIIDVLITKNV